jgi:prepilin-type N-terminal cleavage/methylation domain-containing protein
MNRKEKGFTLVELLVVIAIIAVLAGAVLLAINPLSMLQKARDSKRLADLETVTKALSLAMTDGEVLLGSITSKQAVAGTQAVDGTGWVEFTRPTGKTGLVKWIPALPLDPLSTGDYVYVFTSTVDGFEISAALEHADNLARMQVDGGNDTGRYEVGTLLTLVTTPAAE